MISTRIMRGWALAAVLVMLFSAGALLLATRHADAQWRAVDGWGPYPPPHTYPHPYPYHFSNEAIAAGVAAGVAGVTAGSVLDNALNTPQDQPYSPPSSVYVADPRMAADAAAGGIYHAGSSGPATLAPRWDPDCNQPVAPSGVYVNGQPQTAPCQ